MTTKAISNTLTRWHKIAERIRQAAEEAEQDIIKAVSAGQNIDFDTFEVRKATLVTNANNAIGMQTQSFLNLKRALFSVRRELGRANVAHGVSDLMNEIEETRQTILFYGDLISANDNAMSIGDYEKLGAKRAAANTGVDDSGRRSAVGMNLLSVNPTRVSFLTEEKLAEIKGVRQQMTVRLNSLADRLSDVNASKLTLEIDMDVAFVVGL